MECKTLALEGERKRSCGPTCGREQPMQESSFWDRILQQRRARRRVLAMSAGGAAAAVILAACGGGGSGGSPESGPSKSSTEGTPKKGGTINLSVSAQFGNLHP